MTSLVFAAFDNKITGFRKNIRWLWIMTAAQFFIVVVLCMSWTSMQEDVWKIQEIRNTIENNQKYLDKSMQSLNGRLRILEDLTHE